MATHRNKINKQELNTHTNMNAFTESFHNPEWHN